jgi:hypothetical protein
MRSVSTTVGILLLISLVGCSGSKIENQANPANYQKCIETESAKLLDETGSNADYAMEKAAELCK